MPPRPSFISRSFRRRLGGRLRGNLNPAVLGYSRADTANFAGICPACHPDDERSEEEGSQLRGPEWSPEEHRRDPSFRYLSTTGAGSVTRFGMTWFSVQTARATFDNAMIPDRNMHTPPHASVQHALSRCGADSSPSRRHPREYSRSESRSRRRQPCGAWGAAIGRSVCSRSR